MDNVHWMHLCQAIGLTVLYEAHKADRRRNGRGIIPRYYWAMEALEAGIV